MKSTLLFSLWTVALCVIFIILLGLLLILVISVVRIRRRQKRHRQKKVRSEVDIVTPIHSDDDRNPDVIPQIEGALSSTEWCRESTYQILWKNIALCCRNSYQLLADSKFNQSPALATVCNWIRSVQYVSKIVVARVKLYCCACGRNQEFFNFLTILMHTVRLVFDFRKQIHHIVIQSSSG